MTVKIKLLLNVGVVLMALSILMFSALVGARKTNRSIADLTEKTAPYQLKALHHQKVLQAHTVNLVNLSSSKTTEEYQREASHTLSSLSQLTQASEDLARLKGERLKEDKTISDITKAILENTERKIKTQKAAMTASQPITEDLSKSLTELKAFVEGIQQKDSETVTTNVEGLFSTNDQVQQLQGIKDELKGLTQTTLQIVSATDRRSVSALDEQAKNCLKRIVESFKTLKNPEKVSSEPIKKWTTLNERIERLILLHSQSLGSEDRKWRDMVEGKAKEMVVDLNLILEGLEKMIQEAQGQLKGYMGDMLRTQDHLKNTNKILSLTSELSLLNASIISIINQSIHAKQMKDLELHRNSLKTLFHEANQTGQKVKDFLFNADYGDGMVAIMNYLKTLKQVASSFLDKEGVAEKLKASIQSGNELEKLNAEMQRIVAKHLETSNQEVIAAGTNQEQVVISLNRTARNMVWTISVVGGGIAMIMLIMGFFINRSITKPIQTVVASITEASDQLTAASSQVSSASQSLAEGASEQAAGIEETSSSIEEMASRTKQNAEHAQQANQLSEKGIEMMKNARESMKAMVESIQNITRSSEETGKIVKTIDEIAFQTNLLALNAAVEAARAGEAGAGFAVVADEVRNLAMRAADAAKSTSVLIEDTIKRVREGTALVHRTDESYKEVALTLKKMVGLIGEIASASQEQAQGVERISKALTEMEKVVQKNAASAEESASAAEEMYSQAEQMRGMVEHLIALVKRRNGNGKENGKVGGNRKECLLVYTTRTGHSVSGIENKKGDIQEAPSLGAP